MAIKIRNKSNPKQIVRYKRKLRIRSGLAGTVERPRLAIFRSNKFLYAQLIDDTAGHTIVAASTSESELGEKVSFNNLEGAKALGKLIATRAKAKSIMKVVFDRSGYIYHGKIKAIADSAREFGLEF